MRSTPHDFQSPPLQLSVEGDMTIQHASELKQLLLPALEHPGGLCLQLQAVAEIDATGVQLLLPTHAALSARSRPFRLDACSATVTHALDLLGLRNTLASAADDTLH